MPPRQTSPNPRQAVKPPTPEPAAERMESAKTPADFHELVIQVNSVPVSPSVAMPKPAHMPKPQITRTPPQESHPTFESPSRERAVSPELSRAGSPVYLDCNRAASPAFSMHSTNQGKLASPYSSPNPNRAPSPAFSDIRSARSGSPTLVRANSAATNRSPTSPQDSQPMRSIFPIFDPTKPINQQSYRPTQTSPTHIPKNKISRSPYSPEFYLPHGNVGSEEGGSSTSFPPSPYFTPAPILENLWLAANGQEEPVVQIYTLRMHRATAANKQISFGTTASLPFYSLTQSEVPSSDSNSEVMDHEILIKRHHPTQPRSIPITHLNLEVPPSASSPNDYDNLQQEQTTLLATIYPKLAALAALDAAANSPAASHIAFTDPGATSPAAQRLAEDVLRGAAERECCALAWTRDSSTEQTNPWAHAMTSQGSYQLHHPSLGVFPLQLDGDCSGINSPSTRPTTAVYGHNLPRTMQPHRVQKSGSITLLNPYILSPTSPRAFNPPPPLSPLHTAVRNDATRPYSISQSEADVTDLATTTDATADDTVLARLDLTTDSLLLNVAALTRFGNPFLVDVAATSLLAVAVSESVRSHKNKGTGSQDTVFEPPPPSSMLGQKPKSSTASLKESFVEGLEVFSAKKGKKWSLHSSHTSKSSPLEKDIELGQWYGQEKPKNKSKKGKREKGEKESDLPFVTSTIIGVLSFTFKAVVWVLSIAIKIVTGLVVMISRNISKL